MPEFSEEELDKAVDDFAARVIYVLTRAAAAGYTQGRLQGRQKVLKTIERHGLLQKAASRRSTGTPAKPRPEDKPFGAPTGTADADYVARKAKLFNPGILAAQAQKYADEYRKMLVSKGTIRGNVVHKDGSMSTETIPWLTDMKKTTRNDITKIIQQGLKEGKHPGIKESKSGTYPKGTIGYDLQEYFGQWKSRATTIARTETHRHQWEGSKAEYKDDGITRVRHLCGTDPCPICEEMCGQVYDIDEVPDTPIHPNCLLPGTRVKAPGGIIAGIRAKYDGIAIKLVMADGTSLSVTPNHMFLTRDGWISAKLIDKGDEILQCAGIKGIIPVNPDDDNMPPAIEEVFNSLLMSGGVLSMSVPTTPEYLHGDGELCEGNINVEFPNRFLRGAPDTCPFKATNGKLFYAADTSTGTLAPDSPLTQLLYRAACASDSIVGGHRLVSPVFRGRAVKKKSHGLTDGSDNNTGLNEPSPDSHPVNATRLGDSIQALAGFISPLQVVNIKVFRFHGYVYDLQTISTLLICNGIVTSNCTCDRAPVLTAEQRGYRPSGEAEEGEPDVELKPSVDAAVWDYSPDAAAISDWRYQQSESSPFDYLYDEVGNPIERFSQPDMPSMEVYFNAAGVKAQNAINDVMAKANPTFDNLRIPRLQNVYIPKVMDAGGSMGDGILVMNGDTLKGWEKYWEGSTLPYEQYVERINHIRNKINEYAQKAAFATGAEQRQLNSIIAGLEKERLAIEQTRSPFMKSTYNLEDGIASRRPTLASQYFDTGKERTEATLWHELGHHISQQWHVYTEKDLKAPPLEKRIEEELMATLTDVMRGKLRTGGESATAYALERGKPQEWFAEHFALHKMGRDDLVPPRLKELFKELNI